MGVVATWQRQFCEGQQDSEGMGGGRMEQHTCGPSLEGEDPELRLPPQIFLKVVEEHRMDAGPEGMTAAF